MGYCIRFIEGNPSINRVGIPEGWFLLKGIPPKGRILGLFILVVPLVTSKIIGLARKIRKGTGNWQWKSRKADKSKI
jgi:hypothetical protein